jgi:L-malate glycosyltransferase
MEDNKLNILFLSGWYPNRVLPTLGNFVQKHAEAVALNCNVISLNVCADPNCLNSIEIVESVINDVFTVNVYYKKVKHRIPVLSALQKLFRTVSAYKAGLRIVSSRFTPDLVHHNILYPSGMIALYLKKFRGIPFIITEHSTGYLPLKNRKISTLEKMISKKIAASASVISPVSEDLKNAMQNLGFRGNYKVVSNVVDTKLFYPSDKKKEISKIKFLHISTLDDAHKNISGMLNAIAELSTQRTDFECHFIGDGYASPHVAKAKQLALYSRFAFFDGIKTTVEIAELMRNADCFLMFSNYENMPVVISEALASGIPVIASEVGGIPEHIADERGILVKMRDEKALKDAMNKMIDSLKENIYDKEKLAEYARIHFSYEDVSKKFLHLYRDVLKNNV